MPSSPGRAWESRCQERICTSRTDSDADLAPEAALAGWDWAGPSSHYSNAIAIERGAEIRTSPGQATTCSPIFRVFHNYVQSLQSDTTCSSSAASKFGRVAPLQHQQYRPRKNRSRSRELRHDELPIQASTKPRLSRRPKQATPMLLSSSTDCTSVGFIPFASE